MELSEIKCFLKMFHCFFNRNSDRAALRFLYRNTTAFFLPPGEKAFHSESFLAGGNIIIVSSGLVNGFILEGDLKQTDIWLGTENSVFIWDKSQSPGAFNVESIEQTLIFLMDLNEMTTACAIYPVLHGFLNNYIFARAIQEVNRRNILFRLLEPLSKISRFKKDYPGVFERLPEKLALSYLGICEEHIDRLKPLSSIWCEGAVFPLMN